MSKQGKQLVVIMRGISGSGKSRLARQIAPLIGNCSICSADDFFTCESALQYRFNPAQLGEAHACCLGKFMTRVHNGYNVIVDNTNTQLWEFQNYVRFAAMHECTVCVVDISVETIVHMRRAIHNQVHDVPSDVIWRQLERFESNPEQLEAWGVDHQLEVKFHDQESTVIAVNTLCTIANKANVPI